MLFPSDALSQATAITGAFAMLSQAHGHQAKRALVDAVSSPSLGVADGQRLILPPAFEGNDLLHDFKSPSSEIQRFPSKPFTSRRLSSACALQSSLKVALIDKQEYLSLTEVQAYAIVGGVETNIALNGTADHSSIYDGTNYVASLAIDNVTSYDYDNVFPPVGLVTHTSNELDPWWRVTFDKAYDITKVVLFNRIDCCTERLSNATVTLLDESGNVVKEDSIGNAKNIIEFPIEFNPCTTQLSNNMQTSTTDNWSIDFLSTEANFTQSSDSELILAYGISKDRNVSTSFLQKDCTSGITGIIINSTHTKTNLNATHEKLTVSHSIDKATLGSSKIWNNSTNELEACQIVNLFLPEDGPNPKMNIALDKRIIRVEFDLTANYEILNIDLDAATINTGNSTAGLASYLMACHCDGVGFGCTDVALKPNDELKVCIYSVSPDVLVNDIESMIISQEGDANFTVIDNATVKFPGITKTEKVEEKYGVVASTRIPINLFNFEAENAKIGISGNVLMQLAGDNRRLQADADSIVVGNEEASFDLEVSLQQEFGSDEDPAVSVASFKSKGLVSLGLMFALAYAMW